MSQIEDAPRTGRDGAQNAGIVFSDIDGTLLNSDHQVTPLTREAICGVQRRGVPFVIVTARGITGTYPVLEQNGISCAVVCYSGGVILDEERRVIFHEGLSKAEAQEVADFCEAEGFDMAWSAYSFEDWVSPDVGDPRVKLEERIVMATSREGTIASIEGDEVHKILCFCNPDATDEIERRLRERFPGHSIARSSSILIEVMRGGTSKARAVRTLCEIWGVDPADAIAFGDSYNDVPMLEAAGAGYLMPNAPAPLLGKLPLHAPADNDHDGIYLALRERGLVE